MSKSAAMAFFGMDRYISGSSPNDDESGRPPALTWLVSCRKFLAMAMASDSTTPR
jgi:hypothetical protein